MGEHIADFIKQGISKQRFFDNGDMGLLRALPQGEARVAGYQDRRRGDVSLAQGCDKIEAAHAGQFLVDHALALGLSALFAFLWSMRSGQYEDMDGAAWRVLSDDDL
jgi:cbb3-type cytochrome oxidase maturation protein